MSKNKKPVFDRKVRFLFYRAEFDGHPLDDLISLWTWPWNIGTGPYSHCELWLPDNSFDSRKDVFNINEFNNANYFGPKGTCYTSTMRGKHNGTVKRPASEVLKHLERLDYIEIGLSEELYRAGKLWMEYEVHNNTGYDKKAILSFLFPWRFHNKYKNICSEFAHNYAVIVGLFKLPFEVVSPRRLSRMLTKAGYKIKRLK